MVTRSQQVGILPAAPYKESAQTNGGLRMPQIKLKSKSDFALLCELAVVAISS